MEYFLIALMGALGAMARYGVGRLISVNFPLQTLLVNVAGCFAFEVVVHYLPTCARLPREHVTGLSVGFVGSFTTFSAFGAETSQMLLAGNYMAAVCYAAASFAGGAAGTLGGLNFTLLLAKLHRA